MPQGKMLLANTTSLNIFVHCSHLSNISFLIYIITAFLVDETNQNSEYLIILILTYIMFPVLGVLNTLRPTVKNF